ATLRATPAARLPRGTRRRAWGCRLPIPDVPRWPGEGAPDAPARPESRPAPRAVAARFEPGDPRAPPSDQHYANILALLTTTRPRRPSFRPGQTFSEVTVSKFNQRRVLITGAGRGLGRALFEQLARAGARVVGV